MKPIKNSITETIICPDCQHIIFDRYFETIHLRKDAAFDRQDRKCKLHPHLWMFWWDGTNDGSF